MLLVKAEDLSHSDYSIVVTQTEFDRITSEEVGGTMWPSCTVIAYQKSVKKPFVYIMVLAHT